MIDLVKKLRNSGVDRPIRTNDAVEAGSVLLPTIFIHYHRPEPLMPVDMSVSANYIKELLPTFRLPPILPLYQFDHSLYSIHIHPRLQFVADALAVGEVRES
jgi:hypothetical protein